MLAIVELGIIGFFPGYLTALFKFMSLIPPNEKVFESS
jgi:hypothetical protein